MASKPILSSIPAFDARFGTEGYENIEAPVFKFSLEYSAYYAQQNRVVIIEYTTNKKVYDNTIITQKNEHTLDKDYEISGGLQNGNKYIAYVSVFDKTGNESPSSNGVIFYCYDTPEIKFINFNEETAPPVVNSTSVSFAVLYGKNNELQINSYHFELQDCYGNILDKSDTKYNANAGDVLRWTVGGVEETERDENNELLPNREYKVVCKGETKYGFIINLEQKFVVILEISGVGALVKAENVGDGTVVITSNYKITNAICSSDNPTYLYDENGQPYAIDLTNGDYVEFIDGFTMKEPWEIIIKGMFEVDKLVTLRSADDATEGYIQLHKITYTNTPYYYFSFTVVRNNIYHEIRSDYFVYFQDSLVIAEIDLSYQNGLYSLLANVDYGNATYVLNDDDNGNVDIYFLYNSQISDDDSGNIVLESEDATVSDDDSGNVTIV